MTKVVKVDVQNGLGWRNWLRTWRPELKVEHLMVIGTLGTGVLLYKNYNRICRIKENRKKTLKRANTAINKAADLLAMCDEDDIQSAENESKSNEKNIFVRIFTLDGLFESREKVDKLLNYLWIPSVPRGLSFWKIRKAKKKPKWHYSEFTGDPEVEAVSDAESFKEGQPKNIEHIMKLSHIFGHWTMEEVLELNDTVEYISLAEKEELFKGYVPNADIYFVLSGVLHLTFKDEQGEEYPVKTLHSGDRIISLLSILDFILGNPVATSSTIQAVAQVDTEIMKISTAELVKMFAPTSSLLCDVVRRLVRRTYGVIFTACHQILGMSHELISDLPRIPTKPLENVKAFQKPSPEIIIEASKKLTKFFGMEDKDSKLFGDCVCIVVPANFVLFQAGQMRSKEVLFVSEGELEVCMKSSEAEQSDEQPTPFYVNSGEIFGVMAMLTDEARHFNVKTSATSILVIIPVSILSSLTIQHPSVLKSMVNSVFSRMSVLARQMDYGIEWMYYESGEDIFLAGDDSVATYLVLNGRLRSFLPKRNSVGLDSQQRMNEYGKLDFVGLPEMWTKRRRTKIVLAIRDTEIAKIPFDLLRSICHRFSKVTFQILNYVTNRTVRGYKTSATESESTDNNVTHSTYAIFPASPDVPITYIAREFEQQYDVYGSIIKVDSAFVRERFGVTDDSVDAGLISGLTPWLAYLESTYTKVIYVADPVVNKWSVKCFHQADMIFIAVISDGNKDISEMEQMILEKKSLAKKELWICHKFQEGFPLKEPRYSKMWLEKRRWLSFHHHLYVKSIYFGMSVQKINQLEPEHFGNNWDMARIVRWVTGQSFGLALGGGGAKGAAHIGFLRELTKTLVPIDIACGVSIGSFIGALMALFQDIDRVELITRQWFEKLVYSNNFIFDVTFPYVAIFQGDAMNHSLIEVFGDTQIEDMRTPFFICTTDITSNSIREHHCGSLWRYVRASMSLAFYFCPVCDPRDGHYLVDGGYTNLVPADILRRMGVKYILAVDISSKPNTYRFTNYGDSLSGLNLLSHFSPLPKADPVTVPSCFDIQNRLNFVQSVLYLELVKRMEVLQAHANLPSIIYLRLPIDFYSTGDFGRFENIHNIGNEFARRIFEHVYPGDPIEDIWTKLKENRGHQRVMSRGLEGPSDTSADLHKRPRARSSFKSSRMSKAGQVDLNDANLSLYGAALNSYNAD